MPSVNLRAERINRGLSATAAAKAIDCDPQVLLNAERGDSVPRPQTAFKIAKFYGYKPTDIWPVDEKAAA